MRQATLGHAQQEAVVAHYLMKVLRMLRTPQQLYNQRWRGRCFVYDRWWKTPASEIILRPWHKAVFEIEEKKHVDGPPSLQNFKTTPSFLTMRDFFCFFMDVQATVAQPAC